MQLPILGFTLFALARTGLINKMLFTQTRIASKRFNGVSFFECGAYPSLLGAVRYDLQALSLVAVFLLYDVDLFFFFSEVTALESWGPGQFFLFVIYLLFLILGIAYDLSSQRLGWSS